MLDLDDVLVHSHWARSRGWRTFKRPGTDDFLQHLAQRFELVLYTSQMPTYTDPIMDRLDPNRIILYRLYRCCLGLSRQPQARQCGSCMWFRLPDSYWKWACTECRRCWPALWVEHLTCRAGWSRVTLVSCCVRAVLGRLALHSGVMSMVPGQREGRRAMCKAWAAVPFGSC